MTTEEKINLIAEILKIKTNAVYQKKEKYTCPDCGKKFDRTQGLGIHRSKKHNY